MSKIEKPTRGSSVTEIIAWLNESTEQCNGDLSFKSNLDSYSLNHQEILQLLHSVCERYMAKFIENQCSETSNVATLESTGRVTELEAQLAAQKAELEAKTELEANLNQQLSEKKGEIDSLQIKLREIEQTLKKTENNLTSLTDDLKKPDTFWARVMNFFPDIFTDTQGKIGKLKSDFENEKQQRIKYFNEQQALIKKCDQLREKLRETEAKHQKAHKIWNDERKSLSEKISQLEVEHNEQIVEIVQLKDRKQAESIGDYEKREDYQVVTDYKAFCVNGGLETTAEDIYDYLRQQKEEMKDNSQYMFFNAKIKATLSKRLLIYTYKVQRQMLDSQQDILDFETFFKSHNRYLLSELDLSEDLNSQVKSTIKKGFDLIKQLLESNPPCYLVNADSGDIFDIHEHEIMQDCPKDGIIEFTVVPGIQSGHKLLMKPVVFTKKIN